MKSIITTILLTFFFLTSFTQPGWTGDTYIFPARYSEQTKEFEMQASSIILSLGRKTGELVKKDLLIDLTIENIIYETVAGLKTTFYECRTASGAYILLSITKESEDSYLLSATYEEDNTLIYRGNKWR